MSYLVVVPKMPTVLTTQGTWHHLLQYLQVAFGLQYREVVQCVIELPSGKIHWMD